MDTRDRLRAWREAILTDTRSAAAFPTEHPLHIVEPRFRPSPAVVDIAKETDVILSLDWIDLRGWFIQTFGRGADVPAKVIHCTVDDYLHNGWSMDYFGLPPVDLKILATADQLVRPLIEAVRRLRGTKEKAQPKWPARKAKPLGRPSAEGMMGLRDLALVVREFCDKCGNVTLAGIALGWPSETLSFKHPLDYVGLHAGGGVGAGPSNGVGTALAVKGTDRFPMIIVGDGDFIMGCSAIWTATHMGIPLLMVIANNRAYYNDVSHQERTAVSRGRPAENKFVGQTMDNPAIDLVAMATAQGAEGEGGIETSAELAAAIARGEKAVRAGAVYVIEARIDATKARI